MIEFYSETEFKIDNKNKITRWIKHIIINEGNELSEISYVFCDDDFLLKLNKEYLGHDTLTDIITFDNSVGNIIGGDIYISVERVKENARIYSTTLLNEIHRVMIHGVLHLCGYKDKSKAESNNMKAKEEEALQLLKSL
jgi:rRNA maturation RNase YbeY